MKDRRIVREQPEAIRVAQSGDGKFRFGGGNYPFRFGGGNYPFRGD